MSEVHLDDLQHVVIDDVTVGDVASAMANYPGQAAEIQAALVAWHQAQVQAAVDAATATATATANALIVDRDQARAERDAAIVQRDALTQQNGVLRASFSQTNDECQSVIRDCKIEIYDHGIALLQQLKQQLQGG